MSGVDKDIAAIANIELSPNGSRGVFSLVEGDSTVELFTVSQSMELKHVGQVDTGKSLDSRSFDWTHDGAFFRVNK